MIEIKKVSKRFDKIEAVSDVSLSIEEGQVFGLLGTNGAGKSTLLKVIAGVFKPTEGSVTKHGKMVPLLELGAGFDQELFIRYEIQTWIFDCYSGFSQNPDIGRGIICR